ncbi:Lanthionine biosynthesis protein LanB [Alloactinosynnema sp. L-07]|uniref:lantibiotic dehydratase n=1 Tax=Alloactinosynnema sp. L-07 TaxID=1653480 RepID=UPI00065EF353|nr:lantibiotic dehydratase [Alloactinosynnema sp. L-07]CRK57671.1 Lanthionine biosynthesis protein LanB [Alloactinosynnema sp. L-07]
MFHVVDDAVLLRASAYQPTVMPWPDLADTSIEGIEQWRAWLGQVWASTEFAAAVEAASPALARRVRQIRDGQPRPEREVRRAVLAVARYLLRAQGRSTPFGLFAGIAPCTFGDGPVVRVGDDHRVTTRVDTTWLATVITRLETDPVLRQRLVVVAHNVAFTRDGSLVIAYRQADGGGGEPVDLSIRCLDVVARVMTSARDPIVLGDLAATLAIDFPNQPRSAIDRVLDTLVAQGVLRTELRPPMTSTDPLGHVIATLTRAESDTPADTRELVDALRAIHTDLATHDQSSVPALNHTLRAATEAAMAAVSGTERPLAPDLLLDSDLLLPETIAREAAAAAAALVRLTPEPFGPPNWQTYHGQFLERFGLNAVVPVTDLVNPDTGLGFPSGYRDSLQPPPAGRAMSDRDSALLGLAQKAAMEQEHEIVLDDEMITELAVDDLRTASVQPHTQLRVRVHAPTLDALLRGDFELVVTGVSRSAGLSAGRFLDPFAPEDRARMLRAYQGLPTITENALPVQLSCPPLYPRAENVARTPRVLPHVLSLAEHPPRHADTHLVPIDDLAVTADARRLHLMSMSRRRAVEPLLFSAVELVKHSHPLVRFLTEISTARAAACTAFSWGAASRLPFLPRLRYQRTILSPARWVLTATDLPSPSAPWQDWAKSLTTWRHRYRLPDAVYLGDSDRRLRVDLTEPAHLHLLRAELDRTGHVQLREAPDTSAMGWIDGRAHDIAIPLAATVTPLPRVMPRGPAIRRDHGHLPATGGWQYVKLYSHPDRHTTILTNHIPVLLSTMGGEPDWWFLRYHDPAPHLRLRIRLGDSDFGRIATTIGLWTAGLREAGLLGHVQWDTYYPETGRFGHGPAMRAAEVVFAADSAAALAQLDAAGRRGGPHQHALIAASMVDLAIGLAGGTKAGMRLLTDGIRVPATPALDRAVLDQAIRLANPHDQAALRAVPGGGPIAATWTHRRTALAAYRATLTAQGYITPDSLLPDLLHLHHVRMAGTSPDLERTCARLARAAALSWTHRDRRPSKEPS